MLTTSLLLALISPEASAFCGTYVGGPGVDLYNHASQIVITRRGTQTTLTMANDYEGSPTDFAMLVPIPEVLSEADVAVIEDATIASVADWSGPRLVSYVCDDFQWDSGIALYSEVDSSDSGNSVGGESLESSVNVEANFAVGQYDIVILSAEESGDLLTWLDQNGYSVSADTSDVLQEYIDADTFFLAAKVQLDSSEGVPWLSPLRISYESSVFSLPIKLGTVNSPGVQDLFIYAFAEGEVGIQNYPQLEVEDECLWQDQGDPFGEFYEGIFDAAYAEAEDAGWLPEYVWSPYGCDPCSSTPPSPEVLAELGVQDDWYPLFTRIHMRYSPDQVGADLILYDSNMWNSDQMRYIEYEDYLEDRYPICGEGWAETPGTCDETNSSKITTRCDGCSQTGDSGSLGLLGLLLLGLIRRKESLQRS